MSNEPLNKFQNVVTRATAAIGVKASVFVGSAKLNTQISTLKSEIISLKQELGTRVFELWEKEEVNPDLIAEKCFKIKEKYESIEKLNNEIEKLEREESDIMGSKIEQEQDSPSEDGVSFLCPSCSATFDIPVNFCRKCGTKIQ